MSTRPRPFEVLDVEGRDRLGEGPWWDVATGRLTWVDITGRRVRTATLDGAERPALATPEDVGFAIPDAGGGLVVGLRGGLHRWSPRGWETLWVGDHDPATHRVNDGATDRRGRLWFGTMHEPETEASAALLRYDGRGCHRVLGDVTVSNGLGWSPDDRTLYYTDSRSGLIRAFDHDPEDGTLSRPRVFNRDPAGRFPDGLTVDADGGVWSAKWEGGCVVRYRPDGRVDREIGLPVRRPTSVAFAGGDLRTLAVTSARLDPERDGELAGSVLLLDVGVPGLPEVPVATDVVMGDAGSS